MGFKEPSHISPNPHPVTVIIESDYEALLVLARSLRLRRVAGGAARAPLSAFATRRRFFLRGGTTSESELASPAEDCSGSLSGEISSSSTKSQRSLSMSCAFRPVVERPLVLRSDLSCATVRELRLSTAGGQLWALGFVTAGAEVVVLDVVAVDVCFFFFCDKGVLSTPSMRLIIIFRRDLDIST